MFFYYAATVINRYPNQIPFFTFFDREKSFRFVSLDIVDRKQSVNGKGVTLRWKRNHERGIACWSRKARGGSPVCTCISATTQCIYTERRCKWRENGGGVIVLVCILVLFPLCNWNSSCFRRKRNRCTQVYDTAYAVTSVSVLRLGLVQRFRTMQLRPTTGEGRGRRGLGFLGHAYRV